MTLREVVNPRVNGGNLNGGSCTGSPEPRVDATELSQLRLRHLLVRLGSETKERGKSEMETVS
jgi:hypothetical protein